MKAEDIIYFGKQEVSKIQKYKWKVKDAPGVLEYIDKFDLQICTEYQRRENKYRVLSLARDWSYLACGVLIVAMRNDGFWVIDGQHRYLAAMKRTDIKSLPCIVFESEDIASEAKAFVDANTNRKAMSGTDKFRAMVVSGDINAVYVNQLLNEYDLRIAHTPKKGGDIKCISLLIDIARADRESLERIMDLVVIVCVDVPVHSFLVKGLYYIDKHIDGGLKNARLQERIINAGYSKLMDGITKANAYYANGGGKVYAEGILNIINSGLRNRFILITAQSDKKHKTTKD